LKFILGFDGCLDTPVEILHVFLLGVEKYLVRDFMKSLTPKQKSELNGRIQSFNTGSLNIPSLQPKYLTTHAQSLVGKEFKIFLQAAPFIFFPFMDPDQRKLWHSLSILSSYAFQTRIANMNEFQINIKKYIGAFLYHVVKSSGQWVNKPKFHTLLHLPQSILRFRPAPLFATEKFESYNGVVRNASVHTNRQSPGQDIAVKFCNFHSLRFIFSGGVLYDETTKPTSTSSPVLLNLFRTNHTIQKSMGYNPALANTIIRYPFHNKFASQKDNRVDPPTALKRRLPDQEFRQILDLQLNKHEAVQESSFILVFYILFFIFNLVCFKSF
jgi:hypothetical protein